jgi:7-carboxy-7-deazaguanine synthase
MVSELRVHELFVSLQGESTFAGLPCAFARLAGCNLRCRWCDTPKAQHGGSIRDLGAVRDWLLSAGTRLVEVTGGEPLLQPATRRLLAELCDAGRDVLLETNGSLDLSPVDSRVHRIVDLKAPSSGHEADNRFENLTLLHAGDELKFVLADRADFDWMCGCAERFGLASLGIPILASAVAGALEPAELAAWILRERPPVRLQVQLHKVLWGPAAEGV